MITLIQYLLYPIWQMSCILYLDLIYVRYMTRRDFQPTHNQKKWDTPHPTFFTRHSFSISCSPKLGESCHSTLMMHMCMKICIFYKCKYRKSHADSHKKKKACVMWGVNCSQSAMNIQHPQAIFLCHLLANELNYQTTPPFSSSKFRVPRQPQQIASTLWRCGKALASEKKKSTINPTKNKKPWELENLQGGGKNRGKYK